MQPHTIRRLCMQRLRHALMHCWACMCMRHERLYGLCRAPGPRTVKFRTVCGLSQQKCSNVLAFQRELAPDWHGKFAVHSSLPLHPKAAIFWGFQSARYDSGTASTLSTSSSHTCCRNALLLPKTHPLEVFSFGYGPRGASHPRQDRIGIILLILGRRALPVPRPVGNHACSTSGLVCRSA